MEEKREIKVGNSFYGERGCCIICDEITKETMEGLQRNIYANGKHYDCLCHECKCGKCDLYYREGRFCLWNPA